MWIIPGTLILEPRLTGHMYMFLSCTCTQLRSVNPLLHVHILRDGAPDIGGIYLKIKIKVMGTTYMININSHKEIM